MNRITLIVFVIFFSCKQESNNDYYSDEKNDIEFIQFNFPNFKNWIECYSNVNVKKRFDDLTKGFKIKTIGVYLNHFTESKKDNIEDIDLNDYAIFIIKENEQKWKIKGNDLKRLFGVIKEKTSIQKVSQEDVLTKALTDTLFLKPNKLSVIEEYKPNENLLSALMVIKPYEDDHKYIKLYVMNMMTVKTHLVYASYYIDLNGKESIEKAKQNNLIIMSKFLEINK